MVHQRMANFKRAEVRHVTQAQHSVTMENNNNRQISLLHE